MVLLSLLLATSAVIFWLWLVNEAARVAVLCPEECRCDTDGYYVRCDDSSFTNLPLINFTDVQVFWLYENNITLLQKDSFVSLTELKILRVDWCRLRAIELGAFNGLYINGSEISEIIPGTFENLSNLQHLDLSNSRLEHLDSGVFRGLVNIFRIDITRSTLQYLHPDTFLELPKI